MVEIKLITSKEDYEIAKNIVEKHHSYVPSFKSVGRRIDYLIHKDGEIVGMIGIGSATYPPCKDVLNELGMAKAEYRSIFNNIANNWRFCVSKPSKNLGTQVLKLLRKQAKVDWRDKYGDELKYLMTFVGGGHDGAVYKADNWKIIGKTAGLPPHKSLSMKWDDKESLSRKFVKPDGEHKKIIFFKKI